MQLVTYGASNPQWLLASKFSNRFSAQCLSLESSGGLSMAHMKGCFDVLLIKTKS